MILAMSKKDFYLRYIPIYLSLFMGDALLTSYYSLYFIENGLSGFEQSILLALIPFSLFLGSLVLSPFAKTPTRTLWLFRGAVIIEAGLTLGFSFCNNFVSLLVLTILISFFNGVPFTFLESLASVDSNKRGIPYGNIRLFGTLGYIISLLAGFFLLRNLPFRDVYYFSAGLLVFAVVLSFLVKTEEEEFKREEKEEEAPKRKGSFKSAIPLLIAVSLFYGAFLASGYILPIRLKDLGLPDADYSLIRGISLGAELIALLLMPLLNRFFKRKTIALMVASLLLILSIAFPIFIKDAYGLAYSSLIVSSIGKAFLFAYEARLFEEKIGKKGLGVILTLSNGLVNLIAGSWNLASSSIYENLSFEAFFIILASVALAGRAILIIDEILTRRKEKKAIEKESIR